MSFATQSGSRPVAQPAPTQTIWFASNWRVLVAVIALIASPSLPPTGLSSTYKIKLLTDCKVTYLLASDGHNVGIASEPNHGGRGFLVNTKQPDELYLDPAASRGLQCAKRVPGGHGGLIDSICGPVPLLIKSCQPVH
jgi:hypothetical protein